MGKESSIVFEPKQVITCVTISEEDTRVVEVGNDTSSILEVVD